MDLRTHNLGNITSLYVITMERKFGVIYQMTRHTAHPSAKA